MLLRFRGPDGMVRITIEPEETFEVLAYKVWIHASKINELC